MMYKCMLIVPHTAQVKFKNLTTVQLLLSFAMSAKSWKNGAY